MAEQRSSQSSQQQQSQQGAVAQRSAGGAAPARRDIFGAPLMDLHNEIDRVFDRMLSSFLPSSLARPFSWNLERQFSAPAVDVRETDKDYQIIAELPGMTEDEVEVIQREDTITIRGEHRDEREEKEANYYLMERRRGSFQRSFALPDDVNPEDISAEFSNGVLTLTLPKSRRAQQNEKRIQIRGKGGQQAQQQQGQGASEGNGGAQAQGGGNRTAMPHTEGAGIEEAQAAERAAMEGGGGQQPQA